jgi:hypothetical protein
VYAAQRAYTDRRHRLLFVHEFTNVSAENTHKNELGLYQPANQGGLFYGHGINVTQNPQSVITQHLFDTAMEDSRNTQARHLLLPHRLQPLPGIPEFLRKLTVAVSGQLAGLPQCQGSSQQLTSILVRALCKQAKASL